MSVTERKPGSVSSAAAAEASPPRRDGDVLIGASREAGQAAADAWAIWLAAWQDMAAQQFGLLGRLMDRALPTAGATQAWRELQPDPARSVRLARESCQRMIHSVRTANDAAFGWYFDVADRAAGHLAQRLPDDPNRARNGRDVQSGAR
jgi:hypothetical protein